MAAADFVLDNSVAMRWILLNSNSARVHQYASKVLDGLEAGDTALVPNLWHVEAASVLLRAEKKGVISEAETWKFLAFVAALDMATDAAIANNTVAALARLHGLSGYDAMYLDLAIRSGLPLATVDEDLSKAASAAGVALYFGGV
jgi:predicted nucleic acid-binding protein